MQSSAPPTSISTGCDEATGPDRAEQAYNPTGPVCAMVAAITISSTGNPGKLPTLVSDVCPWSSVGTVECPL